MRFRKPCLSFRAKSLLLIDAIQVENVLARVNEIKTSIANLVAIARQNISDNSDLAQYPVQLAAAAGQSGASVEQDTEEDDVELF